MTANVTWYRSIPGLGPLQIPRALTDKGSFSDVFANLNTSRPKWRGPSPAAVSLGNSSSSDTSYDDDVLAAVNCDDNDNAPPL